MNKRIKIAALIMMPLLLAAGYGYYQFSRRPADIRRQAADIQVTAADLARAFDEDEEKANQAYVDKVLLVTGKLTHTEYDPSGRATMQLDGGNSLASVICSFYKEEMPALKNIETGQTVRVKGVCNGKLMDVILNKCSMVE